MHIWFAAARGVQPKRFRTCDTMMMTAFWAIFVCGCCPIGTYATVFGTTLCITIICAAEQGFPSVRIAICVFHAVFRLERGLIVAMTIRRIPKRPVSPEEKALVAFRAGVGAINLAFIACCTSPMKTFTSIRFCRALFFRTFIRKHALPCSQNACMRKVGSRFTGYKHGALCFDMQTTASYRPEQDCDARQCCCILQQRV